LHWSKINSNKHQKTITHDIKEENPKPKKKRYKITLEGNNIKADKLDLKMFTSIYEKSEELQEAIEENQDRLETINKLTEDIFNALFKYNVEMNPEDSIPPEYLFNRELIEKMQELKEYRELRQYTKLDNFSSAMGTISLVYKILDDIPDLDEIDEQISTIKEKRKEKESLESLINAISPTNKNKKKLSKAKQKLSQVSTELQKEINSMKNKLDSQSREIRQAVRSAIKETNKDIETTTDFASSWGLEPGEIKKLPIDEKLKLAEILNDDKLKKIAQQLGRLRRLAQSKQREKINYIPSEVKSIKTGNDLNRILPIEMTKLVSKKLKKLFLKNYIERSLIEYELKGKEKVGDGPIIACIDNSGSMSGEPEIWSKAVGLALLDIALSRKRDMCIIHFGNKSEIRIFEFSPEDSAVERIEKIQEAASFFFNGGTDFDRPLSEAFDIISKKEKYRKADIVFITDGACSVDIEGTKKRKKELNVQIQTILIGMLGSDIEEVSDYIYTLDSIVKEKNKIDIAGEIFSRV